MNDTSKILKELSNLTLNLDVLAKELKEANSLTKDTNKELSSLVKEKKDPGTKEKVEEKAGEEKNFKNFSESIINAFSKQNESLIGTLEKSLKGGFPGISKTEVKPAGTENQTQTKPGLVTKDLISAIAGRLANIPKLEDGGKINSGGVALVGEKGPELVELQKGNVVNSQDKIAELLKMEMDDRKSAANKKEPLDNKNQEASKIVSGGPKLDEFVTNSFGVKVPKSEIDAYRKEIYDEFKKDFDEDPSLLEDEMKQFIEGYRETMTVSDIQKLSEKTQPKEIKKSEEELQKSKTSKTEKDKSKLQELLSSPKLNPFQNLKEEGMKLAEKFKAKQEQSSPNDLETENFSTQNVTAKDIQALTERLKQGSKLDKETQTLKTAEKSSPTPAATSEGISATSTVEKSAGVKPDIQTTKPEKATQAAPSILTEQDIKEIKGLLAGIYKSINGPLSIASDRPYRPNSNTF
jgi:hypothetical protein